MNPKHNLDIEMPRFKQRALAVSLVLMFCLVAGFVAGLGLGILNIFILMAISLIIFSMVAPNQFLIVIFPLLSVIGQLPLYIGSEAISLERIVVIFGGFGLIGGVFLTRRINLIRWPQEMIFGTIILLAAYISSALLNRSSEGFVVIVSLFQKVALAYLVSTTVKSVKQLYNALMLYLLASLCAAIITIIVFIQSGSAEYIRLSSFEIGDTIQENLIRGVARSGAGNTMAIWISFLFLSQAYRVKSKLFWMSSVVFFAGVAMLALRREVLFMIPLGLIVLLFHRTVAIKSEIVCLGIVISIVVGAMLISVPEWAQRLTEETVGDFSNAQDPRTVLLISFTPRAIATAPWLGHGPGSYEDTQQAFPQTVTAPMLAVGGIPAHNSWSAVAVEAGLIALLGLSMILYAVGRPLWTYHELSDLRFNNLWSFAPLIFVQLLVSLFFGNAIILSLVWFWFGFLISLRSLVIPTCSREAARSFPLKYE